MEVFKGLSAREELRVKLGTELQVLRSPVRAHGLHELSRLRLDDVMPV